MSTEHVVVTETGGSHDAVARDADHAEHEHGMTDKGYVVIAAILAAFTAAEVSLTYMHLPGWIFMTTLLTIMAIKFAMVVSYFMHLKFDNKIFTALFYSGLFLAIFVYSAALTTFHFFSPG